MTATEGMTATGATTPFLVCRVGATLVALPIAAVDETMRVLPLEPFAGMPESVLGHSRARRQLRTFSRLDEGEHKPVSILELVESLLTIVRHRLKTRIRVVTEFGEPDVIDCYPGLLNQALLNLILNSIDAIDGEGTISIQTGAEGDSYHIVATDTGQGIPEAIRARILEPFFTTKPVGEGTGLGLSITDSIIRKHGGALDFNSAEGGGTVATVRLPMREG